MTQYKKWGLGFEEVWMWSSGGAREGGRSGGVCGATADLFGRNTRHQFHTRTLLNTAPGVFYLWLPMHADSLSNRLEGTDSADFSQCCGIQEVGSPQKGIPQDIYGCTSTQLWYMCLSEKSREWLFAPLQICLGCFLFFFSLGIPV